MRSIEAALALDFARRGAKAIAVVMLAIIAVPLWILESLDPNHLIEVASKEAVILHVTLTMVMGFGAAIAVFQAQGNLARFFVRPISAARLAACQMTLGIVTACAMYASAAGLANLWGAQWPVLGPTLFLAATLACAMAMIWSLEGSVLAQLAGSSATTLALFIWFGRHYGAKLVGDWHVMWRAPTAGDACLLALITAVAYAVAVVGVARVRRGDRLDFSCIARWCDALAARWSAPAHFPSPMAAQLWCEWRQKISMAPAVLLIVFLLFPVSQCLLGYLETKTLLEVMIVLPMLALTVFPLVIGLLLGNCGQGPGKNEMRHFIASRPVSDGFLATALLRNIVHSLLWFFSAWAIMWSLVAGIAWLAGYRIAVQESLSLLIHSEVGSPYFLYLPMFSWTLTALVAALIATGRPWFWSTVLVFTLALALSFFVVKMYLSDAAFRQFRNAAMLVWGPAMLLGASAAIVLAFRRRLLSVQTGAVMALVGGAAFGLMSAAFNGFSLHDLPWLVLQTGLVALAAAPLAVMPLAIAWNRHR